MQQPKVKTNPVASSFRLRQISLRSLLPWIALVGVLTVFYVLYFSPVLFANKVLGPGDGEVYYLAFFDLPFTRAWNSMILSGYPVVTDIQAQTLYPLRWISPSFNALVVSAYVLSALGMFGLALKLTGSRIGALIAAVAVSGSGFMLGHLAHLSIIHSAAWVPFILWAVACLRSARNGWPVICGAISVALSIYGGHPQVAIIGLLLCGVYALHEVGVVARSRGPAPAVEILWRVFALFALGLMLAAPALLSVTQAVSDGVRSTWSIEDFGSYSLNPGILRILAFPNIYGTYGPSPFGTYSGPWNLSELAVYVGILPGFLALAAFIGWQRDRSHWFWGAVAVVGLLLSLGTSTPLGQVVYELPVLGKFRAQGRFTLVVILAFGILSSYGTSALLRSPWSRRHVYWLVAACIGLCLFAVASVMLDPTPPHAVGEAVNGALWPRPAFWGALLLMGLSLVLLATLAFKRSPSIAATCVLLVAVDVGSFGWFEQWRYYGSPQTTKQDLPRDVAEVVDTLAQGDGRVLPVDAAEMPYHPLRPNINMRFRIPSVVGYGPLMSSRYANYTRADSVGRFPITDPGAPIMDVLAIRWVAGQGESIAPQLLGTGCGAPTPVKRKLRAILPAGTPISAIRVISHSDCSTTLPTGKPIARLRLLDASGSSLGEYTVDAGEETADWAYDRAGVRASIKHARPSVFETFPAGDFVGLWFQADVSVHQRPGGNPAHAIEVEITQPEGATLRLRTLAAVARDTGTVHVLAMNPDVEASAKLLKPRWQMNGLPAISERIGYRGMVWGVCAARVATPAEIAEALGTHQLSGGGTFDPFGEVLLEVGDAAPMPACKSVPKVSVLDKRDGYWKLRVSGDGASMAVISESYHRDWRAKVGGVKAPVLAADGLIMAVPVPAGEHTLELVYKPKRYRAGLGIAVLALIGCLIYILGALRKANRNRSTT